MRLVRRWRRHRPDRPGAGAGAHEAAHTEAVRAAYLEVLGREPDPAGLVVHVDMIGRGVPIEAIADRLRASPEFAARELNQRAVEAMHRARQEWIRALPAARRILDLGGSSMTNPAGALVEMGYAHVFERLIIVDLPPDLRHELYATGPVADAIESDQGLVEFLYRSMTALSDIDDASIDLVCSGQSFEHVTREDGRRVLQEVHRVVVPDGLLALDTPNRRLTELQLRGVDDEFINPDHKVEYFHEEMRQLFADHGFDVVQEQGLNYMPRSVEAERFDLDELAGSQLVSDDVEACYMLAYLARRM